MLRVEYLKKTFFLKLLYVYYFKSNLKNKFTKKTICEQDDNTIIAYNIIYFYKWHSLLYINLKESTVDKKVKCKKEFI